MGTVSGGENMSMSKKAFIRLADIIKDNQEPNCMFTKHQIEVLADFCREQNSRFDRQRWVGYIRGENGPSGGRIKP